MDTSPKCNLECSRSCFETISILPCENNPIEGFVLAKWDHIVGPRPLYLWKQKKRVDPPSGTKPKTSSKRIKTPGDDKPFCLLSALNYAVGHSLVAGTYISDDSLLEGLIQDKFFVVEDANLLCSAVIFHIPGVGPSEGFSLSLLASYSSYSRVIKLIHFCGKWLKRIAAKLRIYLLKAGGDDAIDVIGNQLISLCRAVIKLQTNPLIKGPLDDCMSVIAETEFFEFVLTSHLQTCGHTVVVGKNISAVNTMLNLLSRFMTNDDLFLSHYAPANTYTPGFSLQGVSSVDGIKAISALDLLSAQYPTTIVDLDHVRVRQGLPIHAHQRARNETLLYELYSLWKGVPPAFRVMESILLPTTQRSAWIGKLVKDLLKMPVPHWDHVIILFMRQLLYKSSSLVECVKAAVKNCAATDKKNLMKQARSLLQVDEVDLRILLAFGEKFNPGIFGTVYNGVDWK